MITIPSDVHFSLIRESTPSYSAFSSIARFLGSFTCYLACPDRDRGWPTLRGWPSHALGDGFCLA